MARRWILTAIVAAVLVVAGALAARAIRDDGTDTASHTARTTTTTGAATSSTTTSAPPTTTVATTTSTVPTSTTGPPGPCGGDTAAIRAAVDAAVNGAAQGADVASCRRAASDTSWAAVQLVAKAGAQFSAVTVVLHDSAGAWSVVAQGGASAGCGQAPQQVIVDLGQFCAGTGGSGSQ